MRHVINTNKPADFDKWLTMDPDHLRILFYNGTIHPEYHEASIYRDEEKIAFAINKVNIKLSSTGKIYTQRQSTAGYTYTFKTKKGKSWFGKPFTLTDCFIKGIKEHFNIDTDWLSDLSYTSSILSSNSIIAKILSGKVTNCRDMIKEYLKYHQRGLKISPEVVYQYLKNAKRTYNYVDFRISLGNAKYLTNPDHCFEPLDQDLLKQAKMLNRKINAKWSSKKQAEIHQAWTREIMEIELKYIEDEQVVYEDVLDLLPGFRLVDSRKDLFQIGKIENHYVYTNYWSNVKSKDTFILYGNYQGVNYTASICNDVFHKKHILSQLHKAHNQGAPQELRDLIVLWLDKPEVQKFFKVNDRTINIFDTSDKALDLFDDI